jgi:hypothetical protein
MLRVGSIPTQPALEWRKMIRADLTQRKDLIFAEVGDERCDCCHQFGDIWRVSEKSWLKRDPTKYKISLYLCEYCINGLYPAELCDWLLEGF